MFGGSIGIMVINSFVISKNADAETNPNWLAVYNLHDYVINYSIFFVTSSFMLLFIILALKISAKYKA